MKYSNDRRSIFLDLKNEEDVGAIADLCTALSSPVRLKILRRLNTPPYGYSVSELVKTLDIPTTTLLFHLEKMEKADIVNISYRSTSSGTTRMVTRKLHDANLCFYYRLDADEVREAQEVQSVSVGAYHDFVGDEINFATSERIYNKLGDDIFHASRSDAQLVFTPNGIITYMFSNRLCKLRKVKKLAFTLEICSEAPYYNNDYLSDVTFWLNGAELTTVTLKGDYGDRRGRLNPEWWSDVLTQHGDLITLSIDDKGVSVNGIEKQNKTTIDKLDLSSGNRIEFSFGNKATAEHIGGFNVFGASFGDYPQDICLTTTYEE
ncbi:MAG: helix-turn-helix domain-containing protein [Clostridia bacterium]|nr:helix-turn-helix domain-containing protein [Clostridia bacterium]